MTPSTKPGQTTLENRLRVRPMTWSHVYRDYWGTHVTAMEAIGDHSALEVEATSTVERTDSVPLPTGGTGRTCADPAVLDRSYEYVSPAPSAPTRATRSSSWPRMPARAAVAARRRLPRRRGRPRADDLPSPGPPTCTPARRTRGPSARGVCQDFAHVTIGALRSLGMPARYVSGLPRAQARGRVGETSKGESHAWVEFWDGGWMPFDPTNGVFVGLDHVVVVRGRDYSDVPAVQGRLLRSSRVHARRRGAFHPAALPRRRHTLVAAMSNRRPTTSAPTGAR